MNMRKTRMSDRLQDGRRIQVFKRAFDELGMRTVWCGYYDGNRKSARVQEKLGFMYHHTFQENLAPLINETRICYANIMTKELWKSRKAGSTGSKEQNRWFILAKCLLRGEKEYRQIKWEKGRRELPERLN